MKKILSCILVLAMIISLAACGKAESTLAEGEYTGTVSSVEGSSITLNTETGTVITFTVNDSTEYTLDMPEMSGGEMPQGGFGGQTDGTQPPEMPSGEMPQGGNGGQQGGTQPPEMPSGEMPQGGSNGQQGDFNAQQGGFGGMQAGLDMITEGTEITVTIGAEGVASAISIQMSGFSGGMAGQPGGEAVSDYTAANTYSENASLSKETIESTGKDENAVLVTGGEVSVDSCSVSRTSSESTGGDNSSFYGVGAAMLATGGTLKVSDTNISTDAAGGAGVFAYGEGTAYVSDCTISTLQGTSGGIHVAGGGTLYAKDLIVETFGESSAAIRSDRGSGTMVVDGGTYTSNGIGSPAIYSTADISVNNADLSANGSEAICIEGKNSIRLYNCNLSGNMDDDPRNDCTWNVILYQSMSGDSEVGNSLFEMSGGTLTANNGGMFYTTNASSTFVLSNVDIVMPADSEFLLKCTGNSNQRGWGQSGSNGAQCSFTAIDQSLSGTIEWDSISTLDMYLMDGSVLNGAFVNDEANAGEGGSGHAVLNLGEGCTWVVNGDSRLTALNLSGTVTDSEGLTVTILGTDGTMYVEGTSLYTVLVDSFTTTADLSTASTLSTFSGFTI